MILLSKGLKLLELAVAGVLALTGFSFEEKIHSRTGCGQKSLLRNSGVWGVVKYRGAQNDYRQTSLLRALNCNYRYRIVRNRSVRMLADMSHYRYRFSLKFELLAITDTDFGLKTNELCNNLGSDSIDPHDFPIFLEPLSRNHRLQTLGVASEKGDS